MKIIFMGTPEFAVPILDILHMRHKVVLVISQPGILDRKKRLVDPPVALYAGEKELPLLQPSAIKNCKEILSYPADLIVTAAYGQFVPKIIINHPRYKSINVHGSLLPQYRGGAPIQRAIMNGDTETGISIIYMTSRMDAGDILAQRAIPIEEVDNQSTMFQKLSLLARRMILPVIGGLEAGTLTAVPQDEEAVTFAANITKEDELIDFQKTAWEVHNHIRGLYPNPGTYFNVEGKSIKVCESQVAPDKVSFSPGIITAVGKDYFNISCGNNTAVSITSVQPPGRRRMNVRDYLCGNGRNLIKIGKEILS